jgi:imidazolonepropionase-like amidohydrolase
MSNKEASVDILFDNCRIIDGKGGVIEQGFAAVKQNRIHAVGSERTPKPQANAVIDLKGNTLLPGIIDSHVHLALSAEADPMASFTRDSDFIVAYKAQKNAHQTLLAGITTVRDLGSTRDIAIHLKNAVASGIVPGPRILSSGKCVCMTGGHGWTMGREADGEAEVRKAVREQLKAGADVIKLMATGGVMTMGVEAGAPQYSFEELRAGVEEAHKGGRKVSSHVQGAVGLRNALKAGIDSIEHGIFIDEETIAMFLERSAYLIPTLSAPHNILKNGTASGIPAYVIEKTERVADANVESAKMAFTKGVTIVMGTDAGTPFNFHGANMKELELLCGVGLSPMNAIISATSTAARLLGLEREVGAVETDKLADLIVVRGNPLDDITLLQQQDRILAIMKGGTFYKNEIG